MVYLSWVYGEIGILHRVSGIFTMGLIYMNVGFVGKVCNFPETKNAITVLISFIFLSFILFCVLVEIKIHLIGCF